MRSLERIKRDVEALKGSGPIIDDFRDMIEWVSLGCPPGWRWDPCFERQIEELGACR